MARLSAASVDLSVVFSVDFMLLVFVCLLFFERLGEARSYYDCVPLLLRTAQREVLCVSERTVFHVTSDVWSLRSGRIAEA